jgi:prevent-host-death family protein
MRTYSVTRAQRQLPRLIRKVGEGEAVEILRHNETVAYLISRERMEAIVETMEFLSNPEAMKAVAAHRAGKEKFLSLAALGRGRG